jgi:pimeloyl-ACP methyl ester carboxylesterase
MGAILLVIVLVSVSAGPLASGTAAFTLIWICVGPFLLAWVIGKGLGKIDLWSKGPDFPVFFAIRPVTDGEWIGVKIRVALVSAAVTWMLVAGITAIWLNFWCEGRPLPRVWALVPDNSLLPRAVIWAWLILAAILITWRLLAGSLYLGLSGNRWLLGITACFVFIAGFAALAALSWLIEDPNSWSCGLIVLPWLPWTLSGLFAAKLAVAAGLGARGIQFGRITTRSALIYLSAWLVGTASLVALVWLLFQNQRSLRYLTAILALFAMPVLRLAIAPFAASANRHRRPRPGPGWFTTWRAQASETALHRNPACLYWLWLCVVCAIAFSAWLASAATRALPRTITVGEARLQFFVTGTGRPTVILWGMDGWERIERETQTFARTVSFDRRASDSSAARPTPLGPSEAARELRSALKLAEIAPPYLLVGHSFGGALVRVFASLYPQETAGIVLVDPFQEDFVDWLKAHQPVNYAEFVRRGELEYVPDWERALGEIRGASRLPDVPVTLLTAVNRTKQEHDALEESISSGEWTEGATAIVSLQRQWLSRIPKGKLVEVEAASHNISQERPELIIRAIKEVAREWKELPR